MSDTTTDAPTGDAEPTPEPTETDATVAAPATTEATPAATETPPAAADSEPKPKPWEPAALARETRLKHEARREAEKLKAELELLRAQLPPKEGETRPATPQMTPDAIRAEADKLREQERYDEARTELIQTGIKELGQETWNKKTEVLAALGATDNQGFMEALVELPDAQKLVAALADDPDRLTALLAKRPTAMAAEMGRMVAELVTPKPKTLSDVAAPVTPVRPRGTTPTPDIADTKNLSVKEWIELRNKQAPRHLGGARKRA